MCSSSWLAPGSLLWFLILPCVISPTPGSLTAISKRKTHVLYFRSDLRFCSPITYLRFLPRCLKSVFNWTCLKVDVPDSLSPNLFLHLFCKGHHQLYKWKMIDYHIFYCLMVIYQILLILPLKHALSLPTIPKSPSSLYQMVSWSPNWSQCLHMKTLCPQYTLC